MPRTFAYFRASTPDDEKNVVAECVSGSASAGHRLASRISLTELEKAMRWSSRSLIDWGAAPWTSGHAEHLRALRVRVHCLAVGDVDLTSSAGLATMAVLTAVAQFERDLLIARTHTELKRARTEGRLPGRLSALSASEQLAVAERLADGESVTHLAREF